MPKILRKLANKLAECAGEWLLLFYINVISKVYSGRLNTKDEVNSINIKIPKIVGEQSNLEIECIFLKGRCMHKKISLLYHDGGHDRNLAAFASR